MAAHDPDPPGLSSTTIPWLKWARAGWLKEPLVHFLLAGGLMFAVVSLWEGPADEGRSIRLERADLLTFLQGRAQVYDESSFAALLDTMDDADRAALVRDAAVQEALYREGIALGLAEADPLIRQRIVQQMRLLLMEEAAADMQVSDAELQAYFDAHKADYALPASASFTHVFVAAGQDQGEEQNRAAALLGQLQRSRVQADQAGRFGDRFLYQLNYSNVGPALVESHFGEAFSDRLFALPEGTWQGPLRSEHGWHLVLLDSKRAGRTPALADVAATVREDALAAKRQAAATRALDRMLARYKIVGPGAE